MSKPMNTWEERWKECVNVNFGDKFHGIGELETKIRITGEIFFDSELQQQRREIVEMIEGMKQDGGGRQSREQANTWYEDNPLNLGYNEALDDIIKKVGGK